MGAMDEHWLQKQAWEPLARLVRDSLADGADSAMVCGGFDTPSGMVGVKTDAVASVKELLRAMNRIHSFGEVRYSLDVEANGHFVVRLQTHATAGPSDDVVLVANALPKPYLVKPKLFQTPRAKNDYAQIEEIIRDQIHDGSGCSDEVLDAAEVLRGIPFPQELRTMWRLATSGRVRFRRECKDDGKCYKITPSFEILSPAPDARGAGAIASAQGRFTEWRVCATQVLYPDPDEVVQELVGSPGWIPFAVDDDNNVYALDLTPGPRGQMGQVIQIVPSVTVGATLVAQSLTDWFACRHEPEDFSPRTQCRRDAMVHRYGPLTVADLAHETDLEVLQIGVVDEPVDLTPILGLPKVRTVVARPGSLADPTQVFEFPALEYLRLGVADWVTVLDEGLMPGQVKVAGVADEDADSHEWVEVMNRLRALVGQPSIQKLVLSGRLTD